jgi:peroxiredoxin
MLEDFEGKQVALSNIAGKKDVVFYFWTATQPRHLGNISRKIAKLSKAYPDFEFVGISIRTESDQYKRNVESYGLDAKRNFRSLDYKKAVSTLIIDKLDKGIVVRDGRIDNAFASIHQPFKGKKY